MKSHSVTRAVLLTGLALMLGAPSPGHIGGCETAPPEVDPYQFCLEKRANVCLRDGASTPPRKSPAEVQNCQTDIQEYCFGFNFECEPSRLQADACLQALLEESRLQQTESQVVECNFCEVD